LRDSLHPRADERYELPAEEQPEIAVAQGAQQSAGAIRAPLCLSLRVVWGFRCFH
jgi:hypothetical protein